MNPIHINGVHGAAEMPVVRETRGGNRLFYAAFTLLGMVPGVLGGYLLGHTWINTLIGLGVGFFVGAGLGLFSHAIITLRRER